MGNTLIRGVKREGHGQNGLSKQDEYRNLRSKLKIYTD